MDGGGHVGDVEEIIFPQLDAFVAVTHVITLTLSVGHGIPRQGPAVADAAVVEKRAAGHGQNAVMVGGDGSGVLSGAAQVGGVFDGQAGRVLRDSQDTLILVHHAAALDPD